MTTWKEAREGKARRENREARFFGPHNLGKPCPECKQRVPLALNDEGITHHPTCGPDARYHMQQEATA